MRTHADTNILVPTTLSGLLLMPCLFPVPYTTTYHAYFGPHSAACWRNNTRSHVFAGFCPSPEDPGPSTCSARPTFSNNLPQPKISRGLNWRTKKKYCMRTCHRLSKSLTSAHYERRHAVTNTAESSPAAFFSSALQENQNGRTVKIQAVPIWPCSS